MGVVYVDQGMAWGTVLGAFIANFIIGGLAKSFGIIVEHFSEIIEAQSQLFLLTGGLIYTFMQIFALVSYLLVEKIGQRLVVAGGSVLATISLIICAYAQEIILWMLSLGIIGGIALGFIYFNVISITGSCFRKYVGLANGIALTGVSIGQMLFPTLINSLIPVYGPRGGALVVAGVFLHILITAALMPTEIIDPENPKPKCDKMKNIDSSPEKDNLLKPNNSPNNGDDEAGNVDTFQMMTSEKGDIEIVKDVGIENASVVRTPEERRANRLFITLLVVYILAKLFGDIGDVGLSFVSPNFAYEMRFTDRQIDLMLAISGACDLVSRLVTGWFSDRKFMIGHRGYLLTAVWAIQGINGFIWSELSGQSWNPDHFKPYLSKPDTRTLVIFFICYGVHGICSGSAMTLMVTVLTDFVGNEKFLMSLSLMMVIVGFFYSPGNFLIGMMKDITDSYAWSVRLCSLLLVIASFVLFFELPSRLLCRLDKDNTINNDNNGNDDSNENLNHGGQTPKTSAWNVAK